MIMTATGGLTIRFTKNFLRPAIRGVFYDENTRLLDGVAELDGYFEVEEVFSVSVRDNFEDEDLDKYIQGMDLIKVTDRTLEIDVLFSDPSAITQNILEPDLLELKIALPQVIVDAETYEQLQETNSFVETTMQPQFSKEEFKKWAQVADQAAQAGTAMSVFEIIICLVTGKALNSMWILINALQFIVFISIWLINMPNLAKLVFDQLKRILLGEFIEDLGFGK